MLTKGSEIQFETLQVQGEQLIFVCVAKEHVVAHYWIKRYVLAPSYPAEETNYAYVLWVTTQSLGQ